MAALDLCQLADVKAWLALPSAAGADDALLARLITAASRFIGSWLNRQVWPPASWREVRDGSGGRVLLFANYPATAVISLSIDGIAVPAMPAPTDGFVSGYTFTPTELVLRGYRFTRRHQNVVFEYTAGYDQLPEDLTQACIELVALRYRERSRIGEVSHSVGGSETVSFSTKDFTESIRAMLTPYRMVAPISGFVRPLPPAAPLGDPIIAVLG